MEENERAINCNYAIDEVVKVADGEVLLAWVEAWR
jgi:hypothetical protein